MLWHSVVLLFIITIHLLVVVFIPPQSCSQEIWFKSKTITDAQKQFIVSYTVPCINRCLSTTTLILKACVQLLSRSTHNPSALTSYHWGPQTLRPIPRLERSTKPGRWNMIMWQNVFWECFLMHFFAQLAHPPPPPNNTWLSSSFGTSYWSCSKDDWDN